MRIELNLLDFEEVREIKNLLQVFMKNGLPKDFDFDMLAISIEDGKVFFTNSKNQKCFLKDMPSKDDFLKKLEDSWNDNITISANETILGLETHVDGKEKFFNEIKDMKFL